MAAFGFVPQGTQVTHMIDAVTSKKDIQVQLFSVPPNYIIPEHTHPNVDSYELLVGGDIRFSKGGKWVTDKDVLPAASSGIEGLHPSRGTLVRVHPETSHGGAFGKSGGVFMSIQQWINGEDGENKLTWRDAATLETEPPYEGW